ncbi:hypothetical protein CHS0354_038784 [Potamilus streckersoni]|uniref:Coiled-coil-helix-coiled-coil-helix domain-containing protein 7 n=1 Tax=Potamilus streckersoni TaxID=2493646 RepID=A0AAE0SRA9_9BIVA|nr:hypothetical protein CHS0354_038784 [Potamilus streckersoni]
MRPNNTTPLTDDDNKNRVAGNVLDREKNPCLRARRFMGSNSSQVVSKTYKSGNSSCLAWHELLEEHQMSLKCLDENYYDKNKCEAYFENYRRCKKFWGKIQRERGRKGIKPVMPPYDEREEILRQHQAKKSS